MGKSWLFALLSLLAVTASCGPDGPGNDPEWTELAVSHYARVERELLAADTSHLSPGQSTERERLIRELRAYRERRDFTVNADFRGARVPYFVDGDGRLCAVANLLHQWGEDDLVARVAAGDNHAYVSDLAGSPELTAWLSGVGLSAWEAARNQVPGSVPPEEETPGPESPGPETPTGPGQTPPDDPGRPETPGPDVSPPSGATPAPPDSTSGPGAGGSPAGPSPSGSPGSARPPAPAAPGGRTLGGGAPGGLSSPGRSAGRGAGHWWLWWELNKLDYLTANPLRIDTGPVTGERSAEMDERNRARLIDARRTSALPALIFELEHPDARVRAAAAISVGRVGGEKAVAPLMEMLDDPQQFVRERAILALGATGSEQAAETLLRIARTGTHKPRNGGSRLSPDARPLGILALGLSRRYGVEGHYDAAVAELIADAKRRDLKELGGAGLLHGVLAPGPKVEAATVRIAQDQNAPDQVRARAIERLGALKGKAAMKVLQRILAGSKLELRRSAAVALGDVDHELVLPRLMTAYELEKEPLTRGFLLLAIARRGGDKASRFLAEELEDGPAALRPWAAIALGLSAREGDLIALEAIRRAELPKAEQGAIWIALGLARDAESLPALKKALAKTGSPRARAHAATALALIGGERARHALLTREPEEGSPAVRVVLAQCLGVLGHDEDADVILAALRASKRPEHMGVLAVGIGFHGGSATLDGLESLLEEERIDPVVRATAVSAIGLLLDRRPGLEFPDLSRRSNFSAAPSWLFPVLLSTL